MLLTFNILFVLLNIGLAKSEPKVTIHQGSLIGKYRTSRLNRTFSSFEGIPFAQPPLGELRFKVVCFYLYIFFIYYFIQATLSRRFYA